MLGSAHPITEGIENEWQNALEELTGELLLLSPPEELARRVDSMGEI